MRVPATLSSPVVITFAVGMAALSIALPAQAADGTLHYRIKVVPMVEGAGLISGTDINNLGDVTGNFRLQGGITKGFIFHHDGNLQVLSTTSPLGGQVEAMAINDRGEVAGTVNGLAVMFRDGAIVPQPATPGLLLTQGYAINNAGVSTGRAVVLSSFATQPFIRDGSSAHVVTVPGSAYGIDINDSGDVLIQQAPPTEENYYLYKEGHITRLPELRPDDLNSLTDYVSINNTGQILANQTSGLGAPYDRFVIYRDGRFDVVTSPDGGGLYASEINDQGWVVGGWENHLGFVYRDGQMHALEDLVRSDYVSRWSSLVNVGINNAGQIVGSGEFYGGRRRVFVATPVPEPGTTALMLAGLCAVGATVQARRQQRSG